MEYFVSEKDKRSICLYFQRVNSVKKTCEKFNRARPTVRAILKANDIKTQSGRFQKQFTCDEQFFAKIDNEASAYWLGFIAADGCVLPEYNILSIILSSKDHGHLLKIKKSMDSSYPVIKRITKRGKNKHLWYSSFRPRSKQLVEDLIALGCTPRKSKTLKFPQETQVPHSQLHHFLRGYFDGDGWIRHASKNGFIFGMVSSRPFINGVCKLLRSLGIYFKRHRDYSGCQGIDVVNCCRAKEVAKIKRYLYKGATLSLDRKRAVFDLLTL